MDLKEMVEIIEKRADEVSILFYKNKSSEAYTAFDNVIKLLAEFVELFLGDNNDVSVESKMDIIQCINELMKALDERDDVLIADILQYELLVRLHEFL